MYQVEWRRKARIACFSVIHSPRRRACSSMMSTMAPKVGGSAGSVPSKTCARSRKSQGRPRQPRPTTTPSQPVSRIIRSASQASQMSPLPSTGIVVTSCLSSAMADHSASPS